MALTPSDKELLKGIYRKVKDQPLKPGTIEFERFYQPIYEIPGKEDPVDFLQKAIQFSEYESLQLFSGFRGSGKTTELFRLRRRLEEEGYVVLYVDALKYISPSDEIDISDLLIVLAGAFSDALDEWAGQLEKPVKLTEETYWERIKNFLTTTTFELAEAGVSLGAESPASQVLGGLKAGLDLKLAIKESPTFRQNLQKLMANRIGELRASVNKFFEDGVKAVKEVWGDDKQVVYIFDSLEQLRGALTNEEGVLRSVERVFANHLNLLRLPYIHAIYTVPPWLQFVMQGSDIYLLPCIRLWNNDGERTHYEPGWEAVRALVFKRIGEEGCERLFGCKQDKPFTSADDLIAVCGGHFRDLLRLLGDIVRRADTLPLTKDVLNSAVMSLRDDYSPIAIEDALWLAKIAEYRTPMLPDTKSQTISRLTRFLDTHVVLYLTNGVKWFDIHPLVRDEVAKLVKLQKEAQIQKDARPQGVNLTDRATQA
ncbi:MAG TPA: hypothetical protein VM934_01700 [Pyrinomonadaceae bacterium]|jgi:hypothetical protein|nr:hypothetical protein [Pyrinomonadaceae bacterium]